MERPCFSLSMLVILGWMVLGLGDTMEKLLFFLVG